eukprot:684337-Prorocentrum_lima.AAC.1
MDSLVQKGVYPLNSNSWYAAQPKYESQPLNVFETGDKKHLNWYCPCCGTEISAGTVDRLLIIVPPSSSGVREQA